VLMEVRLDEFFTEWQITARRCKVVLDDRRPAIYRPDGEFGPAYVTLPVELWERTRRRIKELMRNGWVAPSRTRLCEACGAELKVGLEYDKVWVFKCPVCDSVEIHGKNFVGGTIGAGIKEKR